MQNSLDDRGEADTNGRSFPADIPFLHDLGAEFLGMGNGRAQVALQLAHRHLNSWHVAHGGVIMTLLDVAMSMAGRSLNPELRSGVTVDMNVSFLEPAGQEGEKVVAKALAFHRSTTMVFCEGELWNGERMVAKALGTFKYLRRLDVGNRIN